MTDGDAVRERARVVVQERAHGQSRRIGRADRLGDVEADDENQRKAGERQNEKDRAPVGKTKDERADVGESIGAAVIVALIVAMRARLLGPS